MTFQWKTTKFRKINLIYLIRNHKWIKKCKKNCSGCQGATLYRENQHFLMKLSHICHHVPTI